jgi:hypothetical protein
MQLPQLCKDEAESVTSDRVETAGQHVCYQSRAAVTPWYDGLLLLAVLQGAGLVDELTTCWAMISLKRCAELVRDMTISVPLYTGSIFEPVSSLLAYPVWLLWAEVGTA